MDFNLKKRNIDVILPCHYSPIQNVASLLKKNYMFCFVLTSDSRFVFCGIRELKKIEHLSMLWEMLLNL